MNKLSVVIITFNEESNIASCIRSVRTFSDDIIVVDSGSTDNTIEISKREGARTFSIEWQGYGFSRNYGAEEAKHNWILALDADERVCPELVNSMQQLDLSKKELIFRFRRRNFIGEKAVRFGTMGLDKVTRIYNRTYCKWDLSPVHEKLEPNDAIQMRIRGYLEHRPFKSLEDYRNKAIHYAAMSAEKYFMEGKKAGLIKKWVAPVFNSIKSYVFQFGFLEGKRGFSIARIISHYTWLKYYYLEQLNQTYAATSTPSADLITD